MTDPKHPTTTGTREAIARDHSAGCALLRILAKTPAPATAN